MVHGLEVFCEGAVLLNCRTYSYIFGSYGWSYNGIRLREWYNKKILEVVKKESEVQPKVDLFIPIITAVAVI